MLTAQAVKDTKSLANENLQGFFVNFSHANLCFSNTYRQNEKERVKCQHTFFESRI